MDTKETTMLQVSDTASIELKKVLEKNPDKGNLIIFFQGMGWSGPALGMTLDESIDGKEKMEANGITAYVDPGLQGSLKQFGSTIAIDFVSDPDGRSGFTIKAIGEGDDNCGTCPSASPGCSWAATSFGFILGRSWWIGLFYR